ncbi:AraC family transcriptional regulator [Actinoallomurus bryophytorum]|uniref:AraC family transcriptional regulator n=1 Tax=Actinoallomurus bryophytorum TaxID=1490222 RepID=A0A543CUH1_9ACTN|nr:AraC family transcriptional regulator [Actinoallomurus bryophytorum]TQM00727.1 AraC family transcriptional regulator [Actinoallomurus bryophytorum]
MSVQGLFVSFFGSIGSLVDLITHLIRLARLQAALDKRCLLAGTTLMDVAERGEGEAPFHVLLDGACVLELADRRIQMQAGDVVLLPRGAAHRIRTLGTGRAQAVVETPGTTFDTIHSRTGEPVIDLLCGHYTVGSGAGPMLLRSLPDPLFASFAGSEETDDARMLAAIMRREAQNDGPGTTAVLSSLCNALLAMVLRRSNRRLTEAALWTAVDDERIRAAIDAVFGDPGDDWSIAHLARVAGMSRATFVRRFSRGTGMTVGAFLTNIRLMYAADLLTDTDLTVAVVAAKVGYGSESAFGRAFRQATGSTPARFRRSTAR